MPCLNWKIFRKNQILVFNRCKCTKSLSPEAHLFFTECLHLCGSENESISSDLLFVCTLERVWFGSVRNFESSLFKIQKLIAFSNEKFLKNHQKSLEFLHIQKAIWRLMKIVGSVRFRLCGFEKLFNTSENWSLCTLAHVFHESVGN